MINAAQRVKLKNAEVEVARLGFGSAPLGGLLRSTSDIDAKEAVKAARDYGLSYFDTAPQYGGGLAEERLGAAVRNETRSHLTISTKVGKIVNLQRDGSAVSTGAYIGAPPHEISYDYSYDGTMRSIESSLKRTQLDRFDIILIHDVNRKYHGNEVMERFDQALAGACKALSKLRDDGTIKAFGAAANELDVMIRFATEASINCIMLPQRYTLLDQSAKLTLLPACEQNGIGVLIAGPFDSGVLATGLVDGASYNYQPVTAVIAQRVRKIQELCQEYHVALPAAALQFGFQNPSVVSVVTGMRNSSEVKNNIANMQTEIPDDFWAAFQQLCETIL